MIKTFTPHKPDGLIQQSKEYRKMRLKQPWYSSAEMHPLHQEHNRPSFASKLQLPETQAGARGRKGAR